MKGNIRLTLLLAGLAAAACAPAPAVMPDCDYAGRDGAEEYVFILPSLEEFAGGEGGFSHYTAPRHSARLWLTSFAYQRNYAGRHYKRIGTVEGADGRYHRWLLEDCRLLYSPVEAGLPDGTD